MKHGLVYLRHYGGRMGHLWFTNRGKSLKLMNNILVFDYVWMRQIEDGMIGHVTIHSNPSVNTKVYNSVFLGLILIIYRRTSWAMLY